MSNSRLVSACYLWDTVSQRAGGQQVRFSKLTSPNSPHAGSLQHYCRESQVPRHLHLRGYGCLGHDLRLHGRSPKLYWSCARSILHWIHRSRILSWCTLAHVLVLQAEVVCIPRRRIILGFPSWQCLWRSVRHWHFEV